MLKYEKKNYHRLATKNINKTYKFLTKRMFDLVGKAFITHPRARQTINQSTYLLRTGRCFKGTSEIRRSRYLNEKINLNKRDV